MIEGIGQRIENKDKDENDELEFAVEFDGRIIGKGWRAKVEVPIHLKNLVQMILNSKNQNEQYKFFLQQSKNRRMTTVEVGTWEGIQEVKLSNGLNDKNFIKILPLQFQIMGSTIEQQNLSEYRKNASSTRGKIVFLFLSLFFIIFFFIYGFEAHYYQLPNPSDALHHIPLLLLSTLFTLLGFGPFLSPFKEAKLSGLGITLFVIAFNYLIGALLHQLWFTAFLSYFTGNVDVVAPNAEEFWLRGSQSAVTPSELTFKLSNLCSVSFFIALSGRTGRSTWPEVLLSLVVFNMFWYLNLNLNTFLSHNNPKSLVYFDDYGTNLVYFFGAMFGLIICLLNKTQRKKNQNIKTDDASIVFYFLGAAFLFCAFAIMTTDIVALQGTGQIFRYNAAPANIWFSMIGSVMGTYGASMIVNGGKIGAMQAAIGCVTGAMMTGVGAGYIESIGASLTIGLIAGLFTAILTNTVVKSLNKENIVDGQGFIIPILIICFIGGFIIFPCIIIRHFTLSSQENFTFHALGDLKESQYQTAGYQLAYFGVTLGVSAIAGLIAGFVLRVTKEQYTDFSDHKLYSDDFGLYQEEQKSMIPLKSDEKIESRMNEKKGKEFTEKQLMPDVI